MKTIAPFFATTALIVGLLLIAACSPPQDAPGHSITVMTFNVENLFDNVDDPDKDDRDYLPLAQKQNDAHRQACAQVAVESWRNRCLSIDWNDDIMARKLEVLAQTILQVDGGRGADIVALQEVENIGILERLRTEYLADAGYLPGVLIEGWDTRGIDVAFLTRLPLNAPPLLHEIEFDAAFADRKGDTRGILQADFKLPDGSVMTGFSVHFPAPFHPTEMRVAAYETLNRLLAALPPDRPAFAAGDFNTTATEDADKGLLDALVRPLWTVTHDAGCGDCRGTQYYAPDDSWSFLDMILWRPAAMRGAHATWVLRKNSVRVANKSGLQVLPDGTPWRFTLPEGSGVSDHWPVLMALESK